MPSLNQPPTFDTFSTLVPHFSILPLIKNRKQLSFNLAIEGLHQGEKDFRDQNEKIEKNHHLTA
jgi:hypothetical protein